MAAGIDQRTGQPIDGWPYTVQCLNVVATTMIGERVIREYFGSLTPRLLARENLTQGPLDRFVYALVLQWELWVPMFDVTDWKYVSHDAEKAGGFGIQFHGQHRPNAHLGNYALEASRIIRADIAAGTIEILSGRP